jgi:hypothetical protein
MNTRRKNLFITAISIFILMAFWSCEKKESSDNNNDTTDSVGDYNIVLHEGNGWKSLAHIHAKNTSATGYQWYDLTSCELSIDMSDVLHFILCDSKQTQQDVLKSYYEGTINLSSGDKYLSSFAAYQKDRNYFYKPGTSDLYSAGTNQLQGPFYSYSNNHPVAGSYSGIPDMDENGNIMTYRTLTGVGTENFVFYRKSGSQVDSLFTDGSQAYILSGFFPALLKDGRIYNLVKLGKTVYLQRATAGNYEHNQRGYLETLESIDCPSFIDDLSTSFIASVSPDRRYIYYWIVESYSSPAKGWFFKFDVNTKTLTKVYDNIDLIKGFITDASGKSRTSTIADDGSLFMAGFDNPDASKPVAKIFKVTADGSATSPQEYKSANLLKVDSYGNNYRVNTLQFLDGKLYFTVQSGLLPYENPQLDIIVEE